VNPGVRYLGERVVTLDGAIGTVVELRPDGVLVDLGAAGRRHYGFTELRAARLGLAMP
jgi:hypothetical protein